MFNIGLGLGLNFGRRKGIDAQAQAHFNRVIADGGVVPSGLVGVNAFFKTIKTIYGTSDINSAISAAYDPQVLGYKLGAGSGTTLGQAAQKLYSCSGASGDVVQTTAASQPLLLTHTTGENYWYGSGVANNFVSTPDATANQITGDIEMTAKVIITNQSTTQTIIAKNIDVTNFSYWFGVSSTNNLRLIFSQNGNTTITATSTVIQPFNVNTIGFVKITRVASSGLVRFFTSTDGISYTQLGADVSTTSGNIFNGNASVKVGAYDTTNLFPFFGKIYRATISNSIGGAPVVDFNPNQYNPSTSQTQWTSSTGEVWSINTGTATTGYKGQLVYRNIMQFDGQNARLAGSSSTITNTITQKFGIAAVFSRYTTSTNDFMFNIGGDYGNNNTAGLGCLTNPTPYLFTQGTVLSLNNTSNSQVLNKLTPISTYANYGVSNGSVILMDSIQTNFTINNTTNLPVAPSSTFGICNSGFSNLNGCINTMILMRDGTKFVEINNYIKQINNI